MLFYMKRQHQLKMGASLHEEAASFEALWQVSIVIVKLKIFCSSRFCISIQFQSDTNPADSKPGSDISDWAHLYYSHKLCKLISSTSTTKGLLSRSHKWPHRLYSEDSVTYRKNSISAIPWYYWKLLKAILCPIRKPILKSTDLTETLI